MNDIIKLIIDIIAVTISLVALRYAKKAQKENHLNCIFNLQMKTISNAFECDRVKKTLLCNGKHSIPLALKSGKEYECLPNESLYKNFYLYFKENAETINLLQLNGRQMCCIWLEYCKPLLHRYEFEQTFKCIYSCIESIDRADLSNKEKKNYIEMITSLLTVEQLFSYFINQIAVCSGDSATEDPYVEKLGKYDFFQSLFSNQLFQEISNMIPSEYVRLFSNSRR